MVQGDGEDHIHWSYFINPDKSAAPVFDQLCRGLAQIIRQLEPANDIDLSPGRLANFYRVCGRDFDELFKNTGDHGIAFLYRTLGCYHSLQPTRNAFEAPAIPCLTNDGFVRWQTLQLLLYPDEHTALIQRAVEIYDVPKSGSGGAFFPKSIPRECFPPRPDADMEKWHRFVTSQISQESYMRRLKYSPYQSPQPEGGKSPDGYFDRKTPPNANLKPAGKDVPGSSPRPPNSRLNPNSEAEERARQEALRRRRSVPDVLSPGGTNYHQNVGDRKAARSARSRSANRPMNYPGGEQLRPRSNTGSPAYSPFPTTGYNPQQNNSQTRYGSNTSLDRPEQRPPQPRRDRDWSSTSRPSTEEDVSSEDSYPTRKPKQSGDEVKQLQSRWGASIMPSFFLSSSKRRHSSDGRVPTIQVDKSRSPRRSNSIRKYATEGPSPRSSNVTPDRRDERSSSGVRFQPNSFGPADSPRRPPPHLAENTASAHSTPPSAYRYPEPQPTYPPPLNVPNSNLNVNMNVPPPPPPLPQNMYFPPPASPNVGLSRVDSMNNFGARGPCLPSRIATVSGVNGRRYAPGSPAQATDPNSRRTERAKTVSMRS